MGNCPCFVSQKRKLFSNGSISIETRHRRTGYIKNNGETKDGFNLLNIYLVGFYSEAIKTKYDRTKEFSVK